MVIRICHVLVWSCRWFRAALLPWSVFHHLEIATLPCGREGRSKEEHTLGAKLWMVELNSCGFQSEPSQCYLLLCESGIFQFLFLR